MRPARTPPRLVTLILLAALSTISLNMFLPSLASIAADLEADYALVSLAVALYLGVTAAVQLIVGPASDRLGRRPVLLVALLVFVVASVACALAEDVWTFLAFRMLQAGVAAGYALSLAVVRDTNPERKAAGLIGSISMAMAVAPMLGPLLGGLLDTAFGWRANFWFYALAGAVLLGICWLDLGETRAERASTSASRRQDWLALLGAARFWAFALCTALSTGAFFVFIASAPLIAAETFGVSTALLGAFIGSITGGFMVGSFLSSRLAPRYALTTMAIAGRCVACGGLCLGLGLLLGGILTPLTYFGATIFVGMGNGLTMPSSNAGALSVRPSLAGSAAGLTSALTLGIGALLTTLAGIVVTGAGSPAKLLLLMLAVSLASLACAIWARKAPVRDQRASDL
ncbi:MAG: Bcr/CflA family efflux MFS transporter [Pseudomonadota bacterium]